MNTPAKPITERVAEPELLLEPRVEHLPTVKPKRKMVYEPAPAPTPMDLIAQASARGASAAEIGQLMDLMDRLEARAAEKAFIAAFTEFKLNPPDIIKRLGADFTTEKGRTSYSYADLAIVCDAIIVSLAEHGLTHHWTYAQSGTQATVTCTLTHALGHSRQATLSANDDRTGSKNAIQATGSAVHYLERYTLLGVSGLATRDGTDNDAAGEPLNKDAVKEAVATSRQRAAKPADVAAGKNGEQEGPSEQLLKNARAEADKGHAAFGAFWKLATSAQRGQLSGELADLQHRAAKASAGRQ